MPLAPGTRLGPYEVTAQIGVGGMGEVYQATDTKLKRQVAIKVLPAALADDAERLARFQREAEVLASLNHPNIAAIHGLEDTDGSKALVMELVEGPTLADRIKQGAIPVDEALPIAKQIAEALEAAHEQGIIHRDLKPANIKVKDDGTVKVLDFGLAKALEPAGTMSASVSMSPTITTPAMTEMGMILGTAAYMSPEQARGKAVDKRADIWAFGVVLFEMLTGQRAFEGEDVSLTLAAVLRAEVKLDALPVETPARVRQALATCLQRDLKQRAHDIGDVRLALEGAFETAATEAAESAASPQPLWRHPLPVAAGVAVLTLLVTGLAAWSLWPTAEPQAVNRFDYDVPADRLFRHSGRPVMALSPDGRSFVYNASGGLYWRPMDELEARLIPGTEEDASNPFFSPDGQSVGFYASGTGELKRIALSGGAAVVIGPASNPFGVSWGANETILLGQPEGILRVPATGGTPQVVIAATGGEQMYGPQLLPGGDLVLFTVTSGTWDEGQVVVQSLATDARTVLVNGGRDARYLATGHLVYALGEDLLGVAFDLDTLTVTGVEVPLVQGLLRGVPTGSANYEVSDSGTLVYVNVARVLRTLVWKSRDNTTEPIESIPPNRYLAPLLAPDGERVLVWVDGDAWIYDIASTGRSRAVTSDGMTAAWGAWAPDGLQVAYSSSRGGSVDVWAKPSDGSGEAQQVTELVGAVHVDSWSPDGRVLAVHHHVPGGGTNILMLPLGEANREPERFLDREFSHNGAVFSPDGRYVAYQSQETGQVEINIGPYPGPGPQEPVSVGGGRAAVWAASGELFYQNLTGDVLMVVPVTTEPTLTIGESREVFRGLSGFEPGNLVRSYDVTQSGQRFLMVATGTADSASAVPTVVWVENWTEELKRLVPTD